MSSGLGTQSSQMNQQLHPNIKDKELLPAWTGSGKYLDKVHRGILTNRNLGTSTK